MIQGMQMMPSMNWMEKSFAVRGLQLSMQEHALGVEAEGGTLTVLVAAVHVVTGEVPHL